MCHADHAVHRRADLVAERGDELAPLCALGLRGIELVGEPLHLPLELRNALARLGTACQRAGDGTARRPHPLQLGAHLGLGRPRGVELVPELLHPPVAAGALLAQAHDLGAGLGQVEARLGQLRLEPDRVLVHVGRSLRRPARSRRLELGGDRIESLLQLRQPGVGRGFVLEAGLGPELGRGARLGRRFPRPDRLASRLALVVARLLRPGQHRFGLVLGALGLVPHPLRRGPRLLELRPRRVALRYELLRPRQHPRELGARVAQLRAQGLELGRSTAFSAGGTQPLELGPGPGEFVAHALEVGFDLGGSRVRSIPGRVRDVPARRGGKPGKRELRGQLLHLMLQLGVPGVGLGVELLPDLGGDAVVDVALQPFEGAGFLWRCDWRARHHPARARRGGDAQAAGRVDKTRTGLRRAMRFAHHSDERRISIESLDQPHLRGDPDLGTVLAHQRHESLERLARLAPAHAEERPHEGEPLGRRHDVGAEPADQVARAHARERFDRGAQPVPASLDIAAEDRVGRRVEQLAQSDGSGCERGGVLGPVALLTLAH